MVTQPSALDGHCVILSLSLNDSPFSLTLINIRLLTLSSDKVSVQEAQIAHLRKALSLAPTMYTIMCGDFNFVDRPQDTTSPFSPTSRPHWESLLRERGLADVVCDVHSFFHRPRLDLAFTHLVPRSARVDRFYISHSEADLAIVKPLSSLYKNPLAREGGINTHGAISLKFFPRNPKVKPPSVSEATLRDPAFLSFFEELWPPPAPPQNSPSKNPLENLAIFKDCIHKAALKTSKAKRDIFTKLTLFQRGCALYRYLSLPNPKDNRILQITNNHPSLNSLIFQSFSGWDTTALRNFIDTTFRQDGLPDRSLSNGVSPPITPLIPSPHPGHSRSLVQSLKISLPSTRSKIVALRSDSDSPLVDDEAQLGPIIKSHYKKIWRKVAFDPHMRASSLQSFLARYTNKIDPSLVERPTLETVLRAIHMAPSTCPGPDGVPFLAYKVLADHAGPVLLDVLTRLASPCQNMGEFNLASLFLVPKKETGLVNDTRPISVNNSDNRILAKALFMSVCVAAQTLIGNYQKMFLPGRHMTDHIRSLNESFYEQVFKGEDNFVLFTDNAKAFDSIHHDFILQTLKKQGFPHWFTNAVANLLHDVVVSPSLAPNSKIRIERGVKQGCPLSPLLFILVYDVLIFELLQMDNITVRAAADDLAIQSSSIESITAAFPIIDSFAVHSGLGLNRDKTKVLRSAHTPCVCVCRCVDAAHCVCPCARARVARARAPPPLPPLPPPLPPSGLAPDPCEILRGSNWPLVELVDQHRYLGIIFGRSVTPELLFNGPLTKALARIYKFSPILKRLDTQAKIVTFNVFITTLFSFVEQFFVMPSSIYLEYRAAMHKAITPFNRGGWPYCQLVAPFKKGGFKQPLRDPWVSNAEALLKHVDFPKILAEADLPWCLDGTLRARSDSSAPRYDSPRIRHHSDLALMEFLGPFYLNWDGGSPLKMTKEVIHNVLVDRGTVRYPALARNRVKTLGPDFLHHLAARYGKHGSIASCMAPVHSALLPSTIPSFLISHQVKAVCNALNTDSRRKVFDPTCSTHPSKSTPRDRPCYLCSKDTDSTSHLYGSCPVVKAALRLCLSDPRTPTDPNWSEALDKKTTPLYILDFEAPSEPPIRRLPFLMVFNWAVWKVVSGLRKGRDAGNAAPAILRITLEMRHHWVSCFKAKPKSTYGSASTRTPAQKKLAFEDSSTLIRSLPPHSIVIYTDGSSLGNPGPAGAGAVVTWTPPLGNSLIVRLFFPLGTSTNNVGELWAIGMALQFIRDDPRFRMAISIHPIYILTDSLLSCTSISKGFCKDPFLDSLIREIRPGMASMIRCPLILWIPGHSGVEGNDSADALAVHGSKTSKDLSLSFRTQTEEPFLYHILALA